MVNHSAAMEWPQRAICQPKNRPAMGPLPSLPVVGPGTGVPLVHWVSEQRLVYTGEPSSSLESTQCWKKRSDPTTLSSALPHKCAMVQTPPQSTNPAHTIIKHNENKKAL